MPHIPLSFIKPSLKYQVKPVFLEDKEKQCASKKAISFTDQIVFAVQKFSKERSHLF
jgi:hypothetical protein